MLVHVPHLLSPIKYHVDMPTYTSAIQIVIGTYFSYTLPYIDKILSTSEYSSSYGQHMEMGVVSYVSSCPQLGLVNISG